MSQRDEFFQLLQKLNSQHVKAQPNRPHVLDLPSSTIPYPTVNISSCGSTAAPPPFVRQLSQPTTSASILKVQPSPSNDAWNKLVAVNFRKQTVEVSAFSPVEARPARMNNQNASDASSLLRILQQASNKSPSVQTLTNEGMLAYQCDDQHQLNVSRFIKRNYNRSPSMNATDGLKGSSNLGHGLPTHTIPVYTLSDSEKREKGPRRRYSSSGEGRAARLYAAACGTGSSSEEMEEKDSSMYFYCSDNSDAPIIYPPPDHRHRRNFVSAKHPSHPYGLSSNHIRSKASVLCTKPPEWDDFDLEKDFDFDGNLKLFDKEAFCQDGHQIAPDSSTVDLPVKIGKGDELRSLLGIKNTSTQVSSGACPSKDYRPKGSNNLLSQMSTNSVSTDVYDPAILYSTTTNVDAHELRKVKDNLVLMSSPSTEEEQEYMDYDLDEAGHDLPSQTKPSLEHAYEDDTLLMSAAQLLSKIALPVEENATSEETFNQDKQPLLTKHEMPIPPIDFFQVETKTSPADKVSSDTQYGNTWSIDNPTTVCAQSLQISEKIPLEERDACIEEILSAELCGSNNITSYASFGQDMIQLASRDVAHYFMRLIRKHSIQITPSHPIIFILESGNISSVICLKALYHFLQTFCQCHFNTVEGTLAYVYCSSRDSMNSPLAIYANSLFQTHLAKLSELQHFSTNPAFPLVQIDNLSLSKDTHASINLIIPPMSLSSIATFNLPNLSGSDLLICVDFPLHMSTVISKLSQYYRSAKHLACVMLGCVTCLPWEWRMFLRAVTAPRNEKSLNVALIELPGLLGSGMGKNCTKITSNLLYSYAKLFFTSGGSLLQFVDSYDEI